MKMTFAIVMLIAIAGCAAQNPPAKIDTERQAKIEKALEQLKSKDADRRAKGVLYLISSDAKECIKDIAKLLNDKDTNVRSWAAVALGKFDAKEYTKDIATLLKDKNSRVRIRAAWALRKLDAKEYKDGIQVEQEEEPIFHTYKLDYGIAPGEGWELKR